MPGLDAKTMLLKSPSGSQFPLLILSLKWRKEDRTGGRKDRRIETRNEVRGRGIEGDTGSTEHVIFQKGKSFIQFNN